jgi:aminodeoxychorismate synthase component I
VTLLAYSDDMNGHNRIFSSLCKLPLSGLPDLESLALSWSGQGLSLLESGGEHNERSRWTLLAHSPFARFQSLNKRNRFEFRGEREEWNEAPLLALRKVLSRFPAPDPEPGVPFPGGAIGVFSYELGRELLPLKAASQECLELPEISLQFYERFLLLDHREGLGFALGYGLGDSPESAGKKAEELAQSLRDEIPSEQQAEPVHKRSGESLEVRTSLNGESYRAAVARCREEILDGNAYELCLTTRFETSFEGRPVDLFLEMRKSNPAPFSSYLELPEATLCSSSPERFLSVSPEGRVEARPIKGTRARGASPREDRALKDDLRGSEKDRSENIMIVDLLRNDLSRVCQTGSIHVPELCALETYASVHQMVSTIAGQLPDGRDRLDLLASAFPGGSMTGAPKIAAMQILGELEPCERGFYSGAIGYLSFDGGMDLNIVIRTVQILGKRALVGAGGAVVYDSDPESEWKEALQKAKRPLEALAHAQGKEAFHFVKASGKQRGEGR